MTEMSGQEKEFTSRSLYASHAIVGALSRAIMEITEKPGMSDGAVIAGLCIAVAEITLGKEAPHEADKEFMKLYRIFQKCPTTLFSFLEVRREIFEAVMERNMQERKLQ